MMNDMIHIGCEEMITAADEAQMEHERESVESARVMAWAALEATHGPLVAHDYSAYDGMGWKD